MFIGYPRSRHSLVAALLDAHPEIIISDEYDVLRNWRRKFQSSILIQKNLQKYLLFYELHQLSTKQALFRAKSSFQTENVSYNYHVPGLWQGGYQNRIKVTLKGKVTTFSIILFILVLNVKLSERHIFVLANNGHVLPLYSYHIALLACKHISILPFTILPCYYVTMLACYHVTVLPCYCVNMLPFIPCYHITMLKFYHFVKLPCYDVMKLLYYTVIRLASYHVPMSSFQKE